MLVTSEQIAEKLDVDAMLARATEETGLTDFGDARFIKALRSMVRCYAEDIKVDQFGLQDVHDTIVRQLVNRARFAEDLRKHPEILDEDISDPIIILGLPRSGTTKFHRMIGVDPNLLATRMWQLVNPAPFPNAIPGEPDPRIARSYEQESLLKANDNNPALRAAHLYAAEEVQEDVWLFGLTFNDNYWSSAKPKSWANVRHTMQRTDPSDLDNYKYVADLFKYLQWQQGGRKGRRWLMKHTGHIGWLPELTKTYPNATLVHAHRDPMVSIPSLIKLGTEFTRTQNAEVDPADTAEWAIERYSWLLDRYLADRDRLGLNDRIYDVAYETIRSNPMPAIREIYRRAGHELTPSSEDLMLQYENTNEQGKHGAHRYSLEEYGLSEKIIEDRFGAYIDRFIRPLK